ncbi:MAG TPA: endonuclease III [Actinomycetota bacterium]|nr:endonuclease III [Actinomycetota bacterium]
MGKPKDEARASWADDETPEQKTKRARTILRRLERTYPELHTALDFSTPFELLVATVLSAQSTDKMVNVITKSLFKKYRNPQDYLASKPGELEADIKQSGFFNQKAKSIRGLSRVLLEEFDGEVPHTLHELMRLPGVARKTANVVLSNGFGLNEGIAVDTHVHRLSWRLALSDHHDPVKVERDLMALFPKGPTWHKVTHCLIEHGRAICIARAPKCGDCVVNDLCPASRAPVR